MKWWRRLLCLFGHRWSEGVDLANVTIKSGGVFVNYYRGGYFRFQRHHQIEKDNTVTISIHVCARCEKTKFECESSRLVIREL